MNVLRIFQKITAKAPFIVLIIGFMASQLILPVTVLADPLSSQEVKALNQYPNWVANLCGSDSNTIGSSEPKPTIVIDPGHSGRDIHDIDPQTGLYDHDYPNIPEITEVFSVAQKVRNKLEADGYNVLVTKDSENDSVSFRDRASIANRANADLALSIHDTHDTSWGDMGGGDGGQVYVQHVGDYRQNKPGEGRGQEKITFDDNSVAQKSQQYGRTFAQQRTKNEKHKVTVAPISFDGRAGLPDGNIPMVMLFSKVPWVYNEVGAPRGPLSQQEINNYAQGIVDGVENSIPSSGLGKTPDGASSCSCTGSTSTLTGNDNQEKIFNYFIQKGLSPIAAAAFVGNFWQESGWDPNADQPDGPGRGIAQWSEGDRWDTNPNGNVVDFAKKQGGSPTDLAIQLDFVWYELKHSYSSVLSKLRATNDLETAVRIICEEYEIAGVAAMSNRTDMARQTISKFGSGSTGSAIGCSSPISPDCQNATGNAAILCAAKQYDPVDYVWGGGHEGGEAYHRSCPTIKSNDSSCGLDCSGLVSIAVYDAFHKNGSLSWTTDSIRTDTAHWKKIPYSQIKAGDVVEPDSGHVEIVDHANGSSITTFGAHTSSYAQPDQVGPGHYTDSPGYVYYRYVGSGAP